MTDEHSPTVEPFHDDDDHGFLGVCSCGWKAELVRQNSGDGYDAAIKDAREHSETSHA